jgi:GntR family transcriptional regulator
VAARALLIPPISPAAPGALYQQIVDGVRREVSEGRLLPDTLLPSFRQLSEDLLVSVITVKRAYEELEREGLLYRRQGLGTFVTRTADDRSRAAKTARARDLFRDAAREAVEAGLGDADIIRLLRDVLDDQGGHRHARQRR